MTPLPLRQPPPPLTFVDAVESSVSLGIAGRAVYTALQQRTPTRYLKAAAESRRRPRGRLPQQGPVVVSYLANFLGRAAYLVPELQTDRLRVLYIGWELDQVTHQLQAELDSADVILSMSPYISGVARRHAPHTPVVTALAAPALPEGIVADRARFGLPADKTLFLYIFDPVSSFDRKNPVDVHRAFARAFPGRDDVRLVFKVHGNLAGASAATGVEEERTRSTEFLDLVQGDDRVTLIRDFLPYEQVMQLVASCDAFVSLARAEGIGLPVLEAMSLGVPVVCTASSGHLDFTTPQSALLVPVTMVDVPQGASYHYQADKFTEPPTWADPDLATAAEHLRLLADNPAARSQWGAAAAAQAARYRAECARAAWVEELLAALASPDVLRRHPVKNAAYLALTTPLVNEWLSHERRVAAARRSLAVRTRLGWLKRAALGVARRSDLGGRGDQ